MWIKCRLVFGITERGGKEHECAYKMQQFLPRNTLDNQRLDVLKIISNYWCPEKALTLWIQIRLNSLNLTVGMIPLNQRSLTEG